MLVETPSYRDWLDPLRPLLGLAVSVLGGVAFAAAILRFGAGFVSHEPPGWSALVLVLASLVVLFAFPFGAELPQTGWRRLVPHWSVIVIAPLIILGIALTAPHFVPPARPGMVDWEILAGVAGGGAALLGYAEPKHRLGAPGWIGVAGALVGFAAVCALAYVHYADAISRPLSAEAQLSALWPFVGISLLAFTAVFFWVLDLLIKRSERRERKHEHG